VSVAGLRRGAGDAYDHIGRTDSFFWAEQVSTIGLVVGMSGIAQAIRPRLARCGGRLPDAA
jgi:hypothetical protein